MAAQKIQIGQVWRKNNSDETYLVTRLYTEALATIAVLRPTRQAEASLLRVRVERSPEGQTLPGFAITNSAE
jgi:hypothetical protein